MSRTQEQIRAFHKLMEHVQIIREMRYLSQVPLYSAERYVGDDSVPESKPGAYIQRLSKEDREILSHLKSKDTSEQRPDSI